MLASNLRTRRNTVANASIDILFGDEKPPYFFVGAGLSLASGLPNWTNFIVKCVDQSFDKKLSAQDLSRIHDGQDLLWQLEAALASVKSKKKRTQIIKNSIWGDDPDRIKPNLNHTLLVIIAHALDVPIFTTNYDNLLVKAADEMEIKLPIIDAGKIKSISKLKFGIVAIHGLLNAKESKTGRAIVSQFDYFEEYNQLKPELRLFIKSLAKRSFVFIGTSMTDSNINRAIFKAAQKPKHVNHYLFCRSKVKNQFEKQIFEGLWKRLNVTPIYCSPNYQEVTGVLRRLSNLIHYKNKLPNSSFKNLPPEIFRKKLSDLSKTREFNKCINPWDDFEIDLYTDCSDRREYKVERIFTYRRDKKAGTPPKRTYGIPWFPSRHQSLDESTVIDTLDSLYPSYLIAGQINNSDLRCSGYLSVPIVYKQIGRCIAVIVVKYRNRDNWLSLNTGEAINQSASNSVIDLWNVAQTVFEVL